LASGADPVRAAATRTLYVQIRNAFAAAMVVTVYMAVTAWPYNPPALVLAWTGVQLATQVLRLGLVIAYRRADPPDEALPGWARLVTGYMALAGAVWGSTAFLFIHTDQPITLALTLCGLYGIAGGSVPGNAYNPAGLYAFVGLIFACVFAKLAMQPTAGHIALGVASLGFALILFGFCRVQAASVRESLRIRFENLELLEQLRARTAEAEDARRKAEQASLAKSQFLAAASHDLRQPLYALSLFASSLEGLKLSREGRTVVSRIQANIDALEGLFSGLLDISRLQAGVVTPAFEPVGVDALFGQLEPVFQPMAAEKGLRLQFQGADLWVRSDPVLLEQILVNLVSNALRYTAEGAVTVAAERLEGDQVRLAVSDTGVGIAAGDLARIFEDFVQLANPERDRRKGMGLGLAICQRAAALLGGEIEVASEPGRGSRFALRQPLAAAPRTRAAVSLAAGEDPLGGLSLLFIDDEQEIRDALVRLVGQWGVAVDLAGDAAEALAMVDRGRRYDAILCDYRLAGGLDGLGLIAELLARHRGAEPKAWLVTGDLDQDLMARAQAAGTPLLHKPLKAAQLRALLSHAASVGARGAPSPRASAPSRRSKAAS
jgi:signal transduction histidine kinase/ActR/RegA family two-component response regulator